jgi:hypothetical protein
VAELTWKPTKRQNDFLSLPDSIFECLYGGAAGGGKSEALLNLPIVRQFYENPRFKGILFRRTYPELEAELIVRSESQGIYAACGARYNKEKRRWVFPSGAIIQFGHLEYDSDVRKYDSAEYNYVAFDELTSFTEYQYLYLFSRCRSASSKLPAIVRSGTNPGGIGHGWVRARFVEPAPYGSIMLDSRTGLKRIFIQSKAQDNPYLMENDPQYIARLAGMAEKDRRAKLDGDWYTFSGQVFDDYREELFPGEPSNALHVIEPFDIPAWWPKFLAIDWGFSAMTYALWSALSPEGRVYLYKEYSIKQAKISQWATDIGRMSNGEQLTDIVMCQSAWQQRGDDLNIAEQFTKHSGLRPRLADNARVSGKLLLQEYFRWREKPTRKILPGSEYSNELAAQILRTKGMEAYKSYVISFEPEESETNLPKIQIFNELAVLRKMIPLCIYDDKSKEDVAEFDGDDPYDTLRYNIKAVDYYNFSKLQGKSSHLQQLGNVIKDFEQNGDYTSFHRKLEALERKKVGTARPVRRGGSYARSGR